MSIDVSDLTDLALLRAFVKEVVEGSGLPARISLDHVVKEVEAWCNRNGWSVFIAYCGDSLWCGKLNFDEERSGEFCSDLKTALMRDTVKASRELNGDHR